MQRLDVADGLLYDVHLEMMMLTIVITMSYDAPTWSSVPAPAPLPLRLGTMVARVASSLSSPVPRPRLLSTLLLLSLLLLLSRLYNQRGCQFS